MRATSVWPRYGWAIAVGLGLVVVMLPFIGGVSLSLQREIELAAMYSLLVAGFNIAWGYGGQLALGQVAVFAGGAYAAGILFEHGVTDLAVAIPGAVVVAMVFGLITGLPGLRFSEWGLAIVAFFMLLLIPSLIQLFSSQTGGIIGLPGILGPTLFGATLSLRWFYVATVGGTLVCLLLLRNLMLSRFGQRLLVLKRGDAVAQAIGLSPYRVRLSAYLLASVPAGVAGAFFAYFSTYLQQDIFGFALVTTVLAASVIGGTTSMWAAPVATFVLVFGPDHISAFQRYSTGAYGVFLVLASLGLSGGLAALGRTGWLKLARRHRRAADARLGLVNEAPGRQPADRRDGEGMSLAIPGARLHVTDVAKSFGGIEALRGVNLDAEPGRITAIIGANGAGKTTLLNAVSGHTSVARGEISIDGDDITARSPDKIARRGVARTFQTPQIPDLLTMKDVVASALFCKRRVPALAIALRLPWYRRIMRGDLAHAEVALGFVGLARLGDEVAVEQPLGHRRMLEVARCIAAEPKVILLDEPAAGLDEEAIDRLKAVMIGLRDAGATVVLVEHNVPLVMDVADTVVVMDLGEVIAVGPPEDLREDEQVISAYLGGGGLRHETADVAATPEALHDVRVAGPIEAVDRAAADSVLLDVRHVRYGYGDLVAVWDVSFQARAGEIVAIVGPNGAGKTTLMSGLAGLLPTMAGRVSFRDQEVHMWPAWRRSQAGLLLVPEGKRVFRRLSVEENLLIGLPRGLRRADRKETLQEVFERFPILWEKRSRPASSLSGGQAQLLAIATALVMRPTVLLIDEPSSGLAPIAIEAVFETLEQLKRDGLAIVLVEQRVAEVIAGGVDLVIDIDQGRVAWADVPENVSVAEL